MNECKPAENLKKHVVQIYLLLLDLHRDSTGHVKAIRCHESARIFCEVLRELGFKVEVVNGGYLLSEKKGMQHSWVEFAIDYYGTCLLIETVPHLFFPKLSLEELVAKMVILPDDERWQKYCLVEDDIFSEVLKKRRIKNVDMKLVRNYSALILRTLSKRKTKRFTNG